MCLLTHFFGVFSVKRLQEALKLIFTLIMALILVVCNFFCFGRAYFVGESVPGVV